LATAHSPLAPSAPPRSLDGRSHQSWSGLPGTERRIQPAPCSCSTTPESVMDLARCMRSLSPRFVAHRRPARCGDGGRVGIAQRPSHSEAVRLHGRSWRHWVHQRHHAGRLGSWPRGGCHQCWVGRRCGRGNVSDAKTPVRDGAWLEGPEWTSRVQMGGPSRRRRQREARRDGSPAFQPPASTLERRRSHARSAGRRRGGHAFGVG